MVKRLTRVQIDADLLAGKKISWTGSNGKPTGLQLDTVVRRRLYDFLRTSPVRQGKDLPPAFIDGLWSAYSEGDDPAASALEDGQTMPAQASSWRIKRLQTRNFGGINSFGGPDFSWELDSDSWHLEGENGSGKSSLLSAIVFAFTGRRPRDDQAPDPTKESMVFGADQKRLGAWPALASYPETAIGLQTKPEVKAIVTLENAAGETGKIGHRLVDGKIESHRDGLSALDDVFVSTGIVMPVMLSSLKLGEGEGALTDAVQQLTGLDAIAEIGALCSELAHSAREYRSYAKKKNLELLTREFGSEIKSATDALAPVDVKMPEFKLEDAKDNDGSMVTFGKQIKEEASQHSSLLSDDLEEGLDLTDGATQKRVNIAISAASEQIALGLDGLTSWKQAHALFDCLTDEESAALDVGIAAAEQAIRDALASHERASADDKYFIKARAAARHASKHPGTPIDSCPLCEHPFEATARLKTELEALRDAGPSAVQKLSTNLRDIQDKLLASVAVPLARYVRDADEADPQEQVRRQLVGALGSNSRYGTLLRRLSALLDEALKEAPEATLELRPDPSAEPVSDEHRDLLLKIAKLQYARDLAHWYRDCQLAWTQWWERLVAPPEAEPAPEAAPDAPPPDTGDPESLTGHLTRLTASLDKAKPYSTAAAHLRKAVEAARKALDIQTEQKQRDDVCDAIEPLKSLVALAESVAKQAINDLSGRIGTIAEGMHQAESFAFKNAALERRQGIQVLGGFNSEMMLDARLVANTSWLRSLLWAFVFALRQEAAEQAGADPLPIWLFDDPQATFDGAHRLGWASYVAALQVAAQPAQVVLATHDEAFHNKLKQVNLLGKEALVVRAPRTSIPLVLLDGSKLERAWGKADAERTQENSQRYAHEVRVFLEGMLKAMLAGHVPTTDDLSVSALKDEVVRLSKNDRAPWNRSTFGELAKTLAHGDLICINQVNHTDRTDVQFSDAQRLAKRWANISKQLRGCFRELRNWQLVHGTGSPFNLPESTFEFPDGFGHLLKNKLLPVLGRASAFSGRISDGALDYQESNSGAEDSIRLGKHSAYRLSANTLEPVARPGDILLVREFGEPKPPALVVAIAADRLMARRFVLSETASDVAVLTANAIDPYAIAAPLVANSATIKLKQVVGVLFARPDAYADVSTNELVACRGEAAISDLLGECAGLVEVKGQSAQPLALDGQFILLGPQTNGAGELRRLDGRPVIALDSNQQWFFKRLRLTDSDLVILESLDGGGEYGPEVLWLEGADSSSRRTLKAVRAVLGVLFERPGAPH